MKIKDISEKIPENKREEVIKVIKSCMDSIDCRDVNWEEFNVYDSSAELMTKILENCAVEFLLPIAQKSNEEPEKKITILCNPCTKKEDEVWFVNRNASEIYATISLCLQTRKMFDENQEK